MAYITNANFRKITREFEVPKDKNFTFEDIIIWETSQGYVIDKNHPLIFGWWEVNELLTFKEFCKDTVMAVKHFYRRIDKPQDSYKYVDAEKSPAYHYDVNCEAMRSSFHRIAIPEMIREQGREKVLEFREWWKLHEDLRESKPDAFVARLNLKFGTDVKEFEVEERCNSGVHNMEDNRSIDEINSNIGKLFHDLYEWAKEDEKRNVIFQNFKQLSFLGRSQNTIKNDLGELSEDEVKSVLREIHDRKKEIMDELKMLYQRRYIPNLDFQTSLLENLGFVPCYTCCQSSPSYLEELLKNATEAKTLPSIDWSKF